MQKAICIIAISLMISLLVHGIDGAAQRVKRQGQSYENTVQILHATPDQLPFAIRKCCNRVSVENYKGTFLQDLTYFNKDSTTLVNGKATYTSIDGQYAIWYDNKAWAIGLNEYRNRGTTNVEQNWNGVYLYQNSQDDCPNKTYETAYLWKERDGYEWNEGFLYLTCA